MIIFLRGFYILSGLARECVNVVINEHVIHVESVVLDWPASFMLKLVGRTKHAFRYIFIDFLRCQLNWY